MKKDYSSLEEVSSSLTNQWREILWKKRLLEKWYLEKVPPFETEEHGGEDQEPLQEYVIEEFIERLTVDSRINLHS